MKMIAVILAGLIIYTVAINLSDTFASGWIGGVLAGALLTLLLTK